MNNVTIIIDGKKYQAEQGEPVLKAAKRAGVDIPALCYHEGLAAFGACRLCMVEVVAGGRKGMTTSCTLASVEGLEVKTDTEEIKGVRKGLMELYLAEAPDSDYIKEMAAKYGITESRFASKQEKKKGAPEEKCVLCGLCVRACNEAVGAGVINFIGRGPETKVNSAYQEPSTKCFGCTACADVCPTKLIKISDKKSSRTVETWSQTSVELHTCRICGEVVAPDPLINEVHRKLKDLPDDLKDVCVKCRRRYRIQKLSHMNMAKKT